MIPEFVAHKFKEFMFDSHYKTVFPDSLQNRPFLGFMVAGYSAHEDLGEVWQILINDGWCHGPSQEIPLNGSGAIWKGMSESLDRLLRGFDAEKLVNILTKCQLEHTQISEVIQSCVQELGAPFLDPLMPIQDAIDLAIFLGQTAAQYTRFCQGLDMVGGPIEVASLTKYEGFKWIQRKHFYDKALNY